MGKLEGQRKSLSRSLQDDDVFPLVACDETLVRQWIFHVTHLSSAVAVARRLLADHGLRLKNAAVDTKRMGELLVTADDYLKGAERMKRLKAQRVFVPANQKWTTSNVKAREDEKVWVFSFGLAHGASAGEMPPEGISKYSDERVIEGNVGYGGVVARMEGMEKQGYPVGRFKSFSADRTGYVLLMMNSQDFSNKWGGFICYVVVESSK